MKKLLLRLRNYLGLKMRTKDLNNLRKTEDKIFIEEILLTALKRKLVPFDVLEKAIESNFYSYAPNQLAMQTLSDFLFNDAYGLLNMNDRVLSKIICENDTITKLHQLLKLEKSTKVISDTTFNAILNSIESSYIYSLHNEPKIYFPAFQSKQHEFITFMFNKYATHTNESSLKLNATIIYALRLMRKKQDDSLLYLITEQLMTLDIRTNRYEFSLHHEDIATALAVHFDRVNKEKQKFEVNPQTIIEWLDEKVSIDPSDDEFGVDWDFINANHPN